MKSLLIDFTHFSVFQFHKNSLVLNKHPSDLTMHSSDYGGSFPFFLSYMVSLNMIVLLRKDSPHLCPCLRCSLPLQTHQRCDNSKALYDTCFISLAVKDFTSVKCHPTERRWNCFHQEWENFFFSCTLLNVNYSVLMTFFSFCWPKGEKKLWQQTADSTKRWDTEGHSTEFLYSYAVHRQFSICPVYLLQF